VRRTLIHTHAAGSRGIALIELDEKDLRGLGLSLGHTKHLMARIQSASEQAVDEAQRACKQLVEMGFLNERENLRLLASCNNNVWEAVELASCDSNMWERLMSGQEVVEQPELRRSLEVRAILVHRTPGRTRACAAACKSLSRP
jgi:hypothetical protein